MKISVIIPSFKPQEYLWQCLDSLCNQTFSKEDYELILVLNGCKEPYHSKILEYIKLHSELIWHYIQTDVPGVSNARNMALDVAKGDFVTFIDDDDVVSDYFLEGLFNKASSDTVSLSYTESFTNNICEKSTDYVLTQEFLKKSKEGKIPFHKGAKFFQGPCMKLFHKSIIADRRYDPTFRNGEDSLFMFLISDRLNYVDFTDTRSAYYRRIRSDGANYSKKSLKYRTVNGLTLIKEYFKLFFKQPTKYNVPFFLTRVLGAVKGIVVG